MNIKDKIKKLLSLATSPNENEAKAALLKAKKLMMEHRISEAEVQDLNKQELVHVNCDVKWTTDSGELWIVNLTDIIAENHLCSCSWGTPKGRRTHTLTIHGLKSDVELCKEIIEYAVGFVRGRIKIEQRRRPNSDPKSVARSYAHGFILGLTLSYEEQKEDHPEWGLVVSKPEELSKYMDALGTKEVKTKNVAFDPMAYTKGQEDGKKFNSRKAING